MYCPGLLERMPVTRGTRRMDQSHMLYPVNISRKRTRLKEESQSGHASMVSIFDHHVKSLDASDNEPECSSYDDSSPPRVCDNG